jgi:hypothetical protein
MVRFEQERREKLIAYFVQHKLMTARTYFGILSAYRLDQVSEAGRLASTDGVHEAHDGRQCR